jgi:succinate dehydrogenase/fumarate reductase cytochrome b subunit
MHTSFFQRAASFTLAGLFTVVTLLSANVLALDNASGNVAAQQWAQKTAHRA